MFLNDEVMKKADCMRITFHTVGLLYCFYIVFILFLSYYLFSFKV